MGRVGRNPANANLATLYDCFIQDPGHRLVRHGLRCLMGSVAMNRRSCDGNLSAVFGEIAASIGVARQGVGDRVRRQSGLCFGEKLTQTALGKVS